MSQHSRISLLDNRLANQIAAGEVVERPASVVKELIENSIDAGASRIEVDIERGGIRLMRITDNGCGIHKEDMALALTRHATSKIHSNEDLAAIDTLGFRGEALASISSVSRLTLTSRTQDSDLAWQAIAQGREMAVDIQPAAASPGTRIEIADLFFNTPARQKFLRTEKTEFNHIEEVFKRHALANFHVAFVLKHNHKIVKRVPACAETSQHLKRIASICGQPFVDHAIAFQCDHELVKINGWLGKPSFHRSESDIQYVFINGRPVKDKTLTHAIRQAYEGLLPAGRMATYVIYLELDPAKVDVNVHPTKHEVRLSEQRLVHDLLAKSVSDALADVALPLMARGEDSHLNQLEKEYSLESAPNVYQVEESRRHVTSDSNDSNLPDSSGSEFENSIHSNERQFEPLNADAYQYIQNAIAPNEPLQTSRISSADGGDRAANLTKPSVAKDVSHNREQKKSDGFIAQQGTNLISIAPNYVALKTEQSWHFIQAASLVKKFLKKLLEESVTSSQTGLLFPIEHTLEASILESCECHQLMQRLGFEWRPAGENALKFFKVPAWLLPLGNEVILESLTKWLTFFQQVSFSSKDLINFIEQQVENGELIFDASMLQPMLECIDAHKDLNEEMLKIDKSLLEQLFAQLKPN